MSPFARHFLTAACASVALSATLPAKPSLFIIGDSTVRVGTPGQTGWGDPLVTRFDPARIDVVNRAIGGRSSRSFRTEGRWAAVAANLRPGDFLLIQFGHNDGGPLDDSRGRASLKGGGEETTEIVRQGDGKPETVHTYGWYLRQYAREAKAAGALPIPVSPIPRNIWQNGKITRADRDYGRWAREAAAAEKVPFIDFNALLADAYEALGPERTAALFCGDDHTHASAEGADLNAGVMAAAIRKLDGCALGECLLPDKLWLPAVFFRPQKGVQRPASGARTPPVFAESRLPSEERGEQDGRDGVVGHGAFHR
jgi:lysophospholipase L1-like esterase